MFFVLKQLLRNDLRDISSGLPTHFCPRTFFHKAHNKFSVTRRFCHFTAGAKQSVLTNFQLVKICNHICRTCRNANLVQTDCVLFVSVQANPLLIGSNHYKIASSHTRAGSISVDLLSEKLNRYSIFLPTKSHCLHEFADV